METMNVNWEALDALVIDFAKSENLIEDSISSPPSSPSSSSSSSPSSPSSSSYRSRLLIRQIRRFIEIGDIDAAIDHLRIHASFVLDDHRLLFRLQKQKFIELLRKGTAKDQESAIECLRTALAPCALDAYPEAYEEFKHVLLAFIFDKDDQTSPVVNEWSERRRFEIAGLLSSVLRAHLHAYDPIFSMTLRYLISIHKGFCFRQGIPSPISDLSERLLLEESDPPATPQEALYEAPPFDEVDIQALAHAVELTRQSAVDSLRFAKGNLFQAFQNELCRMKLDVSMLDELVHEYCVYRGIVDSGLASPSDSSLETHSRLSKIYHPEPGNHSMCDSSHNMDCGKQFDGETATNNCEVDLFPETKADTMTIQVTDVEQRSPCDATCNPEDCSTSEAHQGSCKGYERNRSHAAHERSRRKRWRGRIDQPEVSPDFPFFRGSKREPSPSGQFGGTNMIEEQQDTLKHFSNKRVDQKYETVLEMKELATKGFAVEVVEEVNAMDPNFFSQNPILLFQLKQVEFLKLVSCGDHAGAISVASSHLGPLAASNPTLMKPLKETLLALLAPNEDALSKGVPLPILATSLQVAMGRRLGIEEPQLMKIMRATLYSHSEWFKLQRCKDPFEGLLKVETLKEISSPLLIDGTSKTDADSSASGSAQITISSSGKPEDGSSPTQVSSTEIACDEGAILKVMEFLALPRADAIHLLAQYNGNAETVIQQIFA